MKPMTHLSQLLHDLIDHAAPAGNRRGELHEAVAPAIAELLHVPPPFADGEEHEIPGPSSAPAAKFATPVPVKSDAAPKV